MKTQLATPDQDTLKQLRAYAEKHGRNWKNALALDWYHARLEGNLHALRNSPNFGHEWLHKVTLLQITAAIKAD